MLDAAKLWCRCYSVFFFFQAEDGIRDYKVTGVQTCALPILPVLPRVSLLIVGGGHVGQAVARLAADVDFDVWVVDDRELYASRQRFPMARRLDRKSGV